MSAYAQHNEFVGINLDQPQPIAIATKPTTKPRPYFYALALQCWGDLVLAIAFAITWLVISEENPRIRPIRPWDATLSYPATTKDTVPGWCVFNFLFVLHGAKYLRLFHQPRRRVFNSAAAHVFPHRTCIVVPMACLVITVWACECVAAWRTRGTRTAGTMLARGLHFTLQGLYAYVFAMMACEAIKDAVGQPRPQFLSRCQPTPASAVFPAALTSNALQETVVCTNDNKAYMADARRSFPSGHSCSNAVMSAYIISYLVSLAAGVKEVPTGGVSWKDMWRDLLQTAGLLWGLMVFSWPWFVACTRIIDNMHATADVTAGLFLGTTVGVLYGSRAVQRGGALLKRLAAVYIS